MKRSSEVKPNDRSNFDSSYYSLNYNCDSDCVCQSLIGRSISPQSFVLLIDHHIANGMGCLRKQLQSNHAGAATTQEGAELSEVG